MNFDTQTVIEQLYNRTYAGKDLSAAFADEIASCKSPWLWIQKRLDALDFKDILVGDYIPFITEDGEEFEAQIAGIDTYFHTSDAEPGVGHHIDFITRDCRKETVVWNLENQNNGTAQAESPWLSSYLYAFLNTIVYESLPQDLKNVISPKRMMIEKRYDPDQLLTDSNGWQWNDVGRLWVPNEYEVYGSICWGTPGFSSPQAVQYPLFANTWKSRMKGAGKGGERSYWWLMNPFSGDSSRVCLAAIHGNSSRNLCNNPNVRTPICFRIGGKS